MTDGNEKKYSVESRRTFQIIALLSKFFTATREVLSEVEKLLYLIQINLKLPYLILPYRTLPYRTLPFLTLPF